MKPIHSLLTAIICTLMIQVTNAQCFSKKGRCKKTDFWEVQAGAGLLPTFLKDRTQSLMPPVLLGVNYRVKPNISLGLHVGTSVSEASRTIPGDTEPSLHRNHYSTVGLRAAAHTTTLDRWEVYGGMIAGYSTSRVEVRETGSEKSPELVDEYRKNKVYLSAFVGGRYAITRNIGVFTELGMGVSILTSGISWRFQ
ncbi:MAG: hypothetical protein ACKV1O_30490 [Saprospiraceae bacterium]